MSSTTPTSLPLKTYSGNCHCGAFKFHITVPALTQITECNCSICFRKGYKWLFPGEGNLIIDKDAGKLKDYEFGLKTMVHRFCANCGTGVLGKRHEGPVGMQYAVNVRTLMDVDLWSLNVRDYDGSQRDPAYELPPFNGTEPITELQDSKTYTGACHCGAVRVALKTQSLLPNGPEYIQECDCSICARNGTILIYPSRSQVSITLASDTSPPLSQYIFGRRFQTHDFCSVCGVAIFINKLDLETIGREQYARHQKLEGFKGWFDELPINLRLFGGVPWDEIEVKKGNWSKMGEKYVCPP